MLRLKRAATLAAILAVAACTADSRSPTAPGDGPRKTISDAAHAGQVPGFYFLPPMVSQPSYGGTFDAALQPRVEVCELSGTSCGTPIATFTFGTGSSNVRVDAPGQNYIVNWHTAQYNLDPAKFYRIGVYVGTVQLGFADVDVVGAAKDLRNVDTGQYIALLDDRTLPIKFRIETGIVGQVVVSPASDSVNVGETKQFTATLLDLHGNPVTGPTVTWSSSNPAVATIDATGLATGVDAGTVTITASIGYASGTATLKVIQPNTPPVANADTFQAIGNVTIPVSAPGVLANDTDTETPSGLGVVAGTVATANGGTATLAADGSFTYLSAAGFTGTDSFSYTVTDGSLTATGTVTVSVPNRVWYASAGAAAGDGRDASPFATLTAAEGASAAGETIFLLYGNGSGFDTGFTFKNGQSLTGQGIAANVTATVNGGTVVLMAAGSAPTVTNASAGATLQLAQNNTAQGFNVNSTNGAGIAGSGFGTFTAGTMNVAAAGGPSLDLQNGTVAASFATLSSSASAGAGLKLVAVGGTLSAPAGVISGAAGAGVDVSGGDADVTFGGSISGSGTNAASVTGRTGGTLTLSGDITDTNGGILAQNNTGGTIAFTGASKSLTTGASNGVTLANNTGAAISFGGGGLAISTTSGTGFSATGGGTVTVTGAGNTVTASAGTAVRVANTTIGASGITFRSVSAANGANGIVLDNTGSNGFQVTGTGSAGTGGTIANLTGADGSTAGIGIYLNDARNVTLSWMQINDASNFAIRGVDVQGFTLASSAVSGTNGTSAALNEGSISFSGLTGSAAVTSSSISGGISNNVRVVNSTGVLNRLTVSGTTVGANSTTDGTDGFFAQAVNGAVLNLTVQNSFFTAAHANLLTLDLQNTAASDLVLTGNSFVNGSASIVSGAGGVTIQSSGAGANPTLTYAITGNTFRGALGAALGVAKGAGTGSFAGTISSNVIGATGVANSGSAQGSGIAVTSVGGGTQTVLISGNQVRQYNNMGIFLQVGDNANGGNGALNATVQGNTVAEPGTAPTSKNGVHLNAGTTTGDAHQICVAMSGNSITGSGSGGAAGTDFRLRQRMLTTVRLPGYGGANNDNAAVTAFEQANNGGTPTGLVQNTVSTGGGGFVGGAGCPTP